LTRSSIHDVASVASTGRFSREQVPGRFDASISVARRCLRLRGSALENVIWRPAPLAWRSNDSVARMCLVEAALLIF
jgi:hypothetical protein